MGKQIFNIKGMTRDLDPAKSSNQYAYEIRNLRLTAQEDTTLLALTTEKGNIEYTVTGDAIVGNIVGYCTIDKYLTLFTYDNDTNYIYRLIEQDTTVLGSLKLYEGNLGFTDEDTLETIGVFENENIIKVYWIDSKHQPRFINIMADSATIQSWETKDSPFDFIPAMSLKETVEVSRAEYSGIFPAGTIQYALSYFNKNGQQSNIFYISPIYYTSPDNRGGSPEESVSNSFRITINNTDDNFDYIRVYSIQRTSENGTPICKIIKDIKNEGVLVPETQHVFTPTIQTTGVITRTPRIKIWRGGDTTFSENTTIPINTFLTNIDSNKRFYTLNLVNSNTPTRGYVLYYYTGIMTSSGELVKRYTGKIPSGDTARPLIVTETLYFNDAPNDVSYTFSVPSLSPGTSQSDFIEETSFIDSEIRSTDAYYNTISIIDNGMIGQSVDINEILFAGGSAIIPNTMEQKNNVLFFGNYTYADNSLSESEINAISEGINVTYGYSETSVSKGTLGNHYMYKSQLELSNKEITTFKGGEYYTFGIILQTTTGTWTNVVPIGTFLNTLYPKDSQTSFRPVKAFLQISSTILPILSRYKAIKAVYSSHNNVICQGALCPTIFSKKRDDLNGKIYAQSSWYFRTVDGTDIDNPVGYMPYNIHNHSLGTDAATEHHTQEIMGATVNNFYNRTFVDTYEDTDMFVDWNTLTINSPDIQWGSLQKSNARMRLVGAMPITSGITSMNVNLGSPLKNTTRDGLSFTPIVNNNISSMGYQIDLNEYIFNDDLFDAINAGSLSLSNNWGNYSAYYPIYTWQKEGSLTTQNDSTAPYSELKTKVMASLRESAFTDYFINNLDGLDRANLEYDISPFDIYYNDNRGILLERQDESSLYLGAVDTVLLSNMDLYAKYNNTVGKRSIFTNARIRMRYNSSIHGVFSLLNKNNTVTVLPNVLTDSDNTEISDVAGINPILVIDYSMNLNSAPHPSVNVSSDEIAIYYDPEITPFEIGDTIKNEASESSKYYLYYVESKLTEDDGDPLNPSYIAVLKRMDGSFLKAHSLNNHIKITVTDEQETEESMSANETTCKSYVKWIDDTTEYYYPIIYHEVKYQYSETTPIQGYSYDGEYNNSTSEILHYDGVQADTVIQRSSPYGASTPVSNYIYLAEIYLDNPYIERDYKNVVWRVAGLPKIVNTNLKMLEADYGDTYYQRYDCLKTYPYSLEDTNQVIEIFSFMCETKVNIDGRYDLRRGLRDNTVVHDTNFNLLNRAYTQADNIYSYSYIDPKDVVNNFPNQILWTLPKTYGSDIDQWTHIIPTAILDMDGIYGKINSLKLWNENLICFQDTGIAKIAYNDRTALSTVSGVPIEIANSGKVDGKYYISNQVGCKNKKSIAVTQKGLYFIDSNKKELYELSEGLSSLSKSKGFNSYFHTLPDQTLDSIKTFYDPKLRDLYLKIGNECLVYSEQFGEFLSFLDYDTDFILPFGKALIATKDNTLWKQFEGDYLSYFGEDVGYNIEFIAAEYPVVDKTFYNLEFRADVLNGSITEPNIQATANNENKTPFSFVRVWNEYQDTGIVDFTRTIRRNGFSNINQRFRIWHSDIPRDSNDPRGLDRIRSPWVRINLGNAAESKKTVIHDIGVNYL